MSEHTVFLLGFIGFCVLVTMMNWTIAKMNRLTADKLQRMWDESLEEDE